MQEKETQQQPNYYGFLPAIVRYCPNISDGAKVLFAEFSALTVKYGFCNASNSYFSKIYKKDERTISRWISELSNNDFIKVVVEKNYFRRIYLMIDMYSRPIPEYMIDESDVEAFKAQGFDLNLLTKEPETKLKNKKNRSYSKKKKQEVEVLPENEYIKKVNDFFANPEYRQKLKDLYPKWLQLGFKNNDQINKSLISLKEWLLLNTDAKHQRGENGSFMKFIQNCMLRNAKEMNQTKTIIHEQSKPNNAPSYSYTPEQIAEIEAQFNQSFKE